MQTLNQIDVVVLEVKQTLDALLIVILNTHCKIAAEAGSPGGIFELKML